MHAAGGQATADFFPQQRRQIKANQIIQRAARLLGVDQLLRDVARVGHGVQHGLLGDFVKHHALGGFVFQQLFVFQDFQQMPGNRFTFAVRVSCQIDVLGLAHGGGDGVHVFAVLGDDLVFHRKVFVRIHGAVFRHQVADVAIGSENFKIAAQVFFQGLRLGRRFDDQ